MNAVSIVILILAAAAIGAAAVFTVRRSRRGSACCGEHTSVKKLKASDTNRRHYAHEARAEITGMTCENCAVKVQNALNALPGVMADVKIDGRKAKIYTKEPVDEMSIRQAVHGAGYGVGSFTVIR
ncbi:MAG: heavy-metal-associated domain-containing protein [Lachnospiraceae bacterium]|jgi:copper chaperone